MNHADIYITSPRNMEKDSLSEYLNNYKFIFNRTGYQYNDPDSSSCGDRIIGDFEFIYIMSGESYITINENIYKCSKGDMVLIPPFVKHSINSSYTDPHENYWIHFDVFPLYKQEEFISLILYNGDYKVHIGDIEEIKGLFSTLQKEDSEATSGYKIYLNALLVQLLVKIFREIRISDTPDITEIISNCHEKNIVDKCTDFIYDNISSNIGIEDLCRYIHVSESYLFKSFTKILKLSPNKFIQLIKVKKAEQLIKTTSLSFKEISEGLGFNSPYYFSTVFKKHYNASPREYEKSFDDIRK